MPGIWRPPSAYLGSLGKGQGFIDTPGGGDFPPTPADALTAWHALQVALVRTLPKRMTHAAQLRTGTLRNLGRGRRVRR